LKTVFIDPGHGDAGGDMGAVGSGQIKEADINLSIALILRDKLKSNYHVIMSRDTQKGTLPISSDSLGDLPARVDAANRNKADIFISIHCNSFSSPDVEGTEILYYNGSVEGKKLASLIMSEVLSLQKRKIEDTKSNWWKFANRGVKTSDNLYVLKNTSMPAVLCETLFLSNNTNLQLVQNKVFHEVYATAIKTAVDKYFGTGGISQPIAKPTMKRQFIDGNKLKDVAEKWVNKDFNPGKVEQCAAFVRNCLKEAGYSEVGVTTTPSDGYKASETNAYIADSFAGDDVGLRITKRTDLLPGDVIMFYDTYNDGTFKLNSLTHVGICVGNNNFVHRPTAAKPVLKQDITDYGFRWEARRIYLPKSMESTLPQKHVIEYKDPKFSELVSKYCKINNLSEKYIHSIIHQESKYNPLAVSKHNAQGLMQLLPGTFAECARELHLTGDVFNPETNIAAGTYYMRKIANKFFPGVKELNRDQYYIIASSYNQGPNSDGSKYAFEVMNRVPSVS